MPNFYSSVRPPEEPRNRFYPTQGTPTALEPRIPSAPNPSMAAPVPQVPPMPQVQPTPQVPPMPKVQPVPQVSTRRSTPRTRCGNATYFEQRHPILLRRLSLAADTLLDTYPEHDFIYDAYPDYLSLRLMRDRLLRENHALTEEFLQAGCPMEWLSLLTDTILSELLYQKRHSVCSSPVQPQSSEIYRSPMGDANTTSV